MKNKDKRSLIFALALGDGCIHLTSSKTSGAITIDHGLEQADYQAWKAQLLSQIFNRNVRVRTGHKGKSIQCSVSDKKFRVYRKWIYQDGKKDLSRMLKYLLHPEMAAAIWLMDDGYCEPSYSKLADGSKKNYGCRFRLFTCDQTVECQNKIIDWFKVKFDVKVHILYMHDKRTKKTYPYLKMGNADTLKLWSIIREFVLQFKSMQHKFRYAEDMYQLRVIQRPTSK